MRSISLALAAVVFLFAANAADDAPAQETLPLLDYDNFRLCRSVALLHLQLADWEQATVSKEITLSILDQMSFIMIETIASAPSTDIDDVKRRLLFMERYFLGQRRDVADALQSRFSDTAVRDTTLLQCIPSLWRIVSEEISELMKWRARDVDAPARDFAPPELIAPDPSEQR